MGIPFDRVYPEWDYIRTGQLSLNFENGYVDGLRRSWNDGKRQRLEDLVEGITTGIIAYAAGLKVKSEEAARRQRSWDRRSRVSARARKRHEREEERHKILAAITQFVLVAVVYVSVIVPDVVAIL